jgi:hypothetical protein
LSNKLSKGASTPASTAALGANGIQSEVGAQPGIQSTPLPTSSDSLVTSGPPRPDEPRTHGSTSANAVTSQLARPDAQALTLLNSITCAARELPSHIPEAEEDDDIARVVLAEGPEDTSEAWEHLDHVLNRLLGYGVDIEDIARCVRRGPLGVEGLVRYIRGFVVDYGVTGDLLEGKLDRLSKAIGLVKQ